MKSNLWIGTTFPVYESYTLTCEVSFLLQNIGCADVLFTCKWKALSYSLFPQLSQDDSSSELVQIINTTLICFHALYSKS